MSNQTGWFTADPSMPGGGGWYYPVAVPQQPRYDATTLPRVGGSPPFRELVPVTVFDPQRPIYGVQWQYGYTWQSGIQGPPNQSNANYPPGSVLGASGAAAPDFAAYGLYVDTWTSPGVYPIAATQPHPVVNNPPQFTQEGFYGLRASWTEPTWPAVYGGTMGAGALLALPAFMPNVVGLFYRDAINIIATVGGIGFVTGKQDTIYPQQPVSFGTVLIQHPLPGTQVSGAFLAPLVISSGLMYLPQVGDSVANPPNIVIGSTTVP
jgi:PASTA domain